MPKISTLARNTIVSECFGQLYYCHLYSGSIPADGDTAPTGTLLCTIENFTWGTPSGGSVAANAGFNPLVSDTAVATGNAGYAYLTDSVGSFGIYCTVGTSSAEVILSKVHIRAGDTVNLVSITATVPAYP